MTYAITLKENEYTKLSNNDLWDLYCLFLSNQDNGAASPDDLSDLHVEVGRRMNRDGI